MEPEMPNLLAIQLESFEEFLQADLSSDKRKKIGLQRVFEEIFPVSDIRENYTVEFVKYSIGKPRYSIQECQDRNMTYAVPLKATLRLISYEQPEEEEGKETKKKETKKVKDVIENDVFLGEFPLITEQGTFIINGSERVIVSQLHRSPGVFFDDEIHPNGKRLFAARIIPYRGSWVEINLDVNDMMWVSSDGRKKQPITMFLRGLGHSTDEDILKLFYDTEAVAVSSRSVAKVIGKLSAQTVVDKESGEVLISAGEEITENLAEKAVEAGVKDIKVLKIDATKDARVIANTFKKDVTKSTEEALAKFHALQRPGEQFTPEVASNVMEKMFFDAKRCDLGEVGRYMLNQRLKLNTPMTHNALTPDDFIKIISYLLKLRNGEGSIDDIDHLGNRRTRTVGELLENLFSVGLSRVARTIRERLSLKDTEKVAPHELINARTVSSVVDTFFGSSQLSQFMDQTNPLAELTHKRRLSALGPGGLTRERAGFEVRDVHHTHYGRICPIETPEGPNIGLIASLATYARINHLGFLETPYRKVVNGKVTDQLVFLNADEEDDYHIAQAAEPISSHGKFQNDLITCRLRSDYPIVEPSKVDYVDVSPKQLVSVAASLIPFLEHDDANRALMGSNMQRQAVPLLVTDPPYIGTGMEGKAARDSGAVMLTKVAGVVTEADADHITIQPDSKVKGDELGFIEPITYSMIKFKRSNQDTCINYRPIVDVGERVSIGDPIADGPGVHGGELSLGYNALVAFMPWRGYNFEDAIIVSEALVQRDIFTSIHIEEYELQVRDTKRGAEEITREIPNVSEEELSHLDEHGIVKTGTEVEAGDVLVGKVTPKGETELSPEERLLRAIFGEKAADVRDASLKAPPGLKGIVIDTKIFSRKEKSEEAKKREKAESAAIRKKMGDKIKMIKSHLNERLETILEGATSKTLKHAEEGTVLLRAGQKFKEGTLAEVDVLASTWRDGVCSDARLDKKALSIVAEAEKLVGDCQERLDIELDKIARGSELPPGVKQLVKVKIAIRRKLSVGDKMAGRHGNKGVIAKIVPVEDMPYLTDGTPVEIILNPLGVPSRMNVGQLLETHLGWAAKALEMPIATPVFDGASIDEIKGELKKAGLPESGKTVLYDGKSGEPFDNEITVGVIYMMKLSHLVDDKIHARSIGPYSLVTQQPLGGKAQFGGQRFGEMEVWALEAYGAAYALQEMLTVKSDDVVGRSKIYEAIVKGENPPEPGVPESFNVLVKELRSLGLDVELIES
ncbi:MAG: DNA-directed RNA polymerase subunit beta [candidate division Zixibacteria bacterium]|nr:DNA-directed RNA polymerase subunit beta [candidate division Zixibacteria bacterium]